MPVRDSFCENKRLPRNAQVTNDASERLKSSVFTLVPAVCVIVYMPGLIRNWILIQL